MAFDYLNSITEKVQRLNVSGEINWLISLRYSLVPD
jgi:hypothetical protein